MRRALKEEIKRLVKDYLDRVGQRINLVHQRHKLEDFIFGEGEIEADSYEEILQKEQEKRDELDKVESDIVLVDNKLKMIIEKINLLKMLSATQD